MKKCAKAVPICLFTIGLLFFISHFFITQWYHALEVYILSSKTIIHPDNNDIWNVFESPQSKHGAPMHFHTHAFNITNPKAVLHGVSPILQELGPFIYNIIEEKEAIQYEDDTKRTLNYRKTKRYVYNEDLSRQAQLLLNRPYCDPFTTDIFQINIPYATLLRLVRMNVSDTLAKIVTSIIKKSSILFEENIIIQKNLHQYFWGYTDPLLSLVNKVRPSVNPVVSLFQNNTIETTNSVYSGEGDFQSVSQYLIFDGKTKFDCWENEQAGHFANVSSDGYRLPPYLSESSQPSILIPDVFRAVKLKFAGREELHGDLPVMKFVIDPEELASSEEKYHNYYYNQNQWNGAFNITQCAPSNAPIYLSQPHFLDADSRYGNGVVGLNPQPLLHQPAIYAEKKTGLVLKSRFGFQVNYRIEEFYSSRNGMRLLPHYLPVTWVMQVSEAPREKTEMLSMLLYRVEKAVEFWDVYGFAGGIYVMAFSVLVMVVVHYVKRERRGGRGGEETGGGRPWGDDCREVPLLVVDIGEGIKEGNEDDSAEEEEGTERMERGERDQRLAQQFRMWGHEESMPPSAGTSPARDLGMGVVGSRGPSRREIFISSPSRQQHSQRESLCLSPSVRSGAVSRRLPRFQDTGYAHSCSPSRRQIYETSNSGANSQNPSRRQQTIKIHILS